TEHADDTPTGKLMEAIIESVDEFYSENLAQEVLRGMRESASRGFWMPMLAPYGYRKVHVQDGAKKRPRLELDPPADAVVRRMFDMALHGSSTLDIARALNADGVQSPFGTKWLKATIYRMLSNEVYTGTLVWGKKAKDNMPPVRVEDAFPAIVTAQEFKRTARLLGSRAPGSVHPRRIASPYLLSGLLKCEACGRALSASESGRGRYTYYVCHSLLNRGKGTCETPRLSAKRFERLIVEQIREHILTESNMRDLVRMVNEEMDSVIAGERERLEAAELELAEVRRRMDRLWQLVEKTDMTVEDILPRIRHHQENQERLERAADEARVELDARLAGVQDAEVVAAYAREMGEWLLESGLAETKAFLRTFVKQIVVRPGRATIHYAVPTPEDSPIGGADVAEVTLGLRFMKSVSSGEPVEPRVTHPHWQLPSARYNRATERTTNARPLRQPRLRRLGARHRIASGAHTQRRRDHQHERDTHAHRARGPAAQRPWFGSDTNPHGVRSPADDHDWLE
ncbi:MAG: recombinase family protein, partial [Chloroflexi bacterium]|nr:recombinase family protein [Chloroflexota bacterium]